MFNHGIPHAHIPYILHKQMRVAQKNMLSQQKNYFT